MRESEAVEIDQKEARRVEEARQTGATPPHAPRPASAGEAPRSRRIPVVIAMGVVLVLALGALMIWRAESRTNKIALASAPIPVTISPAAAATFRPFRQYVGTVRPWIEASVGPQFISAYVDTVLVRPGAVVRKGEVLATLDCRNASSANRAVAQQARAIEARQKALADEAARTQKLLTGGFVSENEAEQKLAKSAAEEASLEAEKANLAKSSLSVSDCVLRAPFDGEVGDRFADPGAFIRPGNPIVTVVDRHTVRMVADAPESDFRMVAPGTPVRVHVLSTGMDLTASVSRRAPAADPSTRTVHFEADVSDPQRRIPVNTTMELRVDVGQPIRATSMPVYAATTTERAATFYQVDGDTARKVSLHPLGEISGLLFFAPDQLAAGTKVVTEGRALLADGAKVQAREATAPATGNGAAVSRGAAPARGAGEEKR